MKQFKAFNGPMPTTAAQLKVTTGTAIKTMQQIAPPAGGSIYIVEYGVSFDGFAAAAPGTVELIETDVAATVTAYVAADITKYSEPGGDASNVTLGIGASGYTSSAEGAITAVREGDAQLIPPTGQYVYQFPPGQEFEIRASKFARIRVTFAAAINALTYIKWLE